MSKVISILALISCLSYLTTSASLALNSTTEYLTSNDSNLSMSALPTLSAQEIRYSEPFQIPDSTIWMRLDPAIKPSVSSLNYKAIDDLWLWSSAEVDQMIREKGPNAYIERSPSGMQSFRETLNGVELYINARKPEVGRPFMAITWGILKDILTGIDMAMLGRRMLKEVYLMFWDDNQSIQSMSGEHVRGNHLGVGSVKWVGSKSTASS